MDSNLTLEEMEREAYQRGLPTAPLLAKLCECQADKPIAEEMADALTLLEIEISKSKRMGNRKAILAALALCFEVTDREYE